MNFLVIVLRLVHVIAGVVWVGGAWLFWIDSGGFMSSLTKSPAGLASARVHW